MSGDWIKMRHSLARDGRVVRMASTMQVSKREVIGALFLAWTLADEQTTDGHLADYTSAALDEHVGLTGFAQAMKGAGWLAETLLGIEFAEFDKHNGDTAKGRALKNARQAKWRDGVDATPSTTPSTGASTREEKRREEIKDISPGFVKFWSAWPSSQRKVAKAQCMAKWSTQRCEEHADRIVAHVEDMKNSKQWMDGNGVYIPAPLVYLNQRRWEAAVSVADQYAQNIPGSR